MLKKAGLTEILEQKDLSPQNFLDKIKYCLERKDSYVLKNEKMLEFLKENPADLIANEVIKSF